MVLVLGGRGSERRFGDAQMITFMKTSLKSLYLWITKIAQCISYFFRKESRKVIQYQTVCYDMVPLSPLTRQRLSMVRRKTMVLDLDETLIHSHHDGILRPMVKPGTPPDFVLKVTIDRHPVRFFVHKRPHVDFFLSVINQWFDLVIFTASMEIYGAAVADKLDKGRGLLNRRYFRQHCTMDYAGYSKDLASISPDLASIFILDNSPGAYRQYPDNAIPIKSWFCDPTDTALLALLPFLDALRFTNDVRSVLSRNLAVHSCKLIVSKSDDNWDGYEYFERKCAAIAVPSLHCAEVISGRLGSQIPAMGWVGPDSSDVDTAAVVSDCDRLNSEFAFPSRPHSGAEAAFPLAYALTAHAHARQVLEFLSAVYQPQNVYCLAVDLGSPLAFQAAMDALPACLPNVIVLPKSERFDILWGGPEILKAQLACLGVLLKSSVAWRYVFTLSASSDFPLRTNEELVAVLNSFAGANDGELNPGQPERYRASMQFDFHHFRRKDEPRYKALFEIEHRSLGRNITFFADLWTQKSVPPGNLNIYKGNAANSLSRPFVTHLMSAEIWKELESWVQDTGSAEEQFWGTALHNPQTGAPGSFPGVCLPFYQNLKTRKPYKDWLTRYHVWNPNAEDIREDRPCLGTFERAACVFGVRDLPTLTKLPHFFAHKFRPHFQAAALQCLREWQCNRTLFRPADLDLWAYAQLPAARFQRSSSPDDFVC